MFPERLIAAVTPAADGGLCLQNGLSLEIRLPWYRALPLSSVHSADVRIDGQLIPAGDITFELGGESYRLAELASRHDVWWYVLDSAFLRVSVPLPDDGQHEVELVLALFIPYLPVDGEPLLITEKCVAAIPARQVAA